VVASHQTDLLAAARCITLRDGRLAKR